MLQKHWIFIVAGTMQLRPHALSVE